MAFDWTATLYSQYANSPVILALLESFSAAVDAESDINGFYNDVWNIETARGYGLDFWGRVVGVQRVIPVAASKYLGFTEAGTISADPFNNSPFYPGYSSASSFPLSDDAFRTLILAKAAANIWDGSIPGLNSILRLLFPGAASYVQDNQNMTMTIVLGFTPSAVQQSILFNTGVLPRPAGVSVSYV